MLCFRDTLKTIPFPYRHVQYVVSDFLTYRGQHTMPKFNIVRSIKIEAAPEKAFDVVADYGSWTTWSPWLCAEPDAKVTISDDANSVGSVYAWVGDVVGQGEIEHVKLDRPKLIEQDIRFLKPFKSRSDVSFTFEEVDGGTRMSWAMAGSMPWFLFWMIPMMKTMISMDYDRGLKMLKEYIETGKILSKTVVRGVEQVDALKMCGVRNTCQFDEIGPTMSADIQKAHDQLQANDIPVDCAPITVYHDLNFKTMVFEYTTGYVVPESTNTPQGLNSWSMPAGKALAVEHTGSYDNLGNAWSAANQILRYKKLKQSKVGTYEIYKNSPEDTAPADLITEIYLPLK